MVQHSYATLKFVYDIVSRRQSHINFMSRVTTLLCNNALWLVKSSLMACNIQNASCQSGIITLWLTFYLILAPWPDPIKNCTVLIFKYSHGMFNFFNETEFFEMDAKNLWARSLFRRRSLLFLSATLFHLYLMFAGESQVGGINSDHFQHHHSSATHRKLFYLLFVSNWNDSDFKSRNFHSFVFGQA